MEVLAWLSNTFWDEKFWLPSNYSWSDFHDDDPSLLYPNLYQISMTIPVGLSLLVIRYFVETYVFKPIGRCYGLQEKTARRVAPNKVLEKIYRRCKRPSFEEMKGLAERTAMSTRAVEVWFRCRRNMDKYSLLKKFSESGWRFMFYLCAFVAGVCVLWSKPYFWQTKECWLGYPKQPIDRDIYWYYMIELGFYWSLLVSIFTDVKRKDFYEMMIHHVATISLLVFSWVCNFVRVGALVLAVHDAVDYWMEAAKMAKYVGKNKMCDILFTIFTVIWFFTRLTIFPFRILQTTFFEGLRVSGVQPFPAYYLFNGLLVLLQVLHLIWFCFIVKMAIEILTLGQLQKDARSDSELSDEDAEPREALNNNNNNVEHAKDNGATHSNGFAPADGNGNVPRRRTKV